MEKPQTSVLQASALELQERLTDGSLTTLALTTLFLDQIDRHNRRGLRLNAVVSVAPREKLLARAKSLDQERSTGTIRSKLHGVPVIVKVDIQGRC
jgi:amidase